MANKWLLWLGWSEPVRTGVVDVSPSGITGMISVGRDSTKGGGGYGVKVWCIQSLDKCFGFGVREDEHSWRFFEQHSRGMLGIAGESCISSLSQGCAVIFVKQKSSLDQSMWLQLPRDLVGTSATEESPWTGEFRSPGEHCWCPLCSHSSKGVITCVHNLYSPVYKSFSSLKKKNHHHHQQNELDDFTL